MDARFDGLGPGHRSEVSLHFEVAAYGSDTAQSVSRITEESYQRIMHDTGMYSFVGSRPYPIAVYADRAEYLRKTDLPEWSGGAALGNSIVSFEGEHLEATLTHEMTHLLLYEAMGARIASYRWLNEGLAVYEEAQSRLPELQRRILASGRSRVAANPMPFAQMFDFAPATEREREVDIWYQQSGMVVRFLIERGGRLGFSIFLKSLRDGRSLDEALNEGFPGLWRDARTLEQSWLGSLKQ